MSPTPSCPLRCGPGVALGRKARPAAPGSPGKPRSRVRAQELPPPPEEMARRARAALDQGFPYIVAEVPSTAVPGGQSRIVGYAYGSLFAERAAYRHTMEHSIYVDRSFHGRGVGRALLDALLEQCRSRGYRTCIGKASLQPGLPLLENPSVAFHTRMGFQVRGTLQAVGRKFDQLSDVVLLQRDLVGEEGNQG